MALVTCTHCHQETLDTYGICERCGAHFPEKDRNSPANAAGGVESSEGGTRHANEGGVVDTTLKTGIEQLGKDTGRTIQAGEPGQPALERGASETQRRSKVANIPKWAQWEAGLGESEKEERRRKLHRTGYAVADDQLLDAIRNKPWYGYHRPAAGLTRRTGAMLIDLLIVGLPLVTFLSTLESSLPSDIRVLVWFMILLGPVIYFGVADGAGGTAGKRLMGISVTDMEGRTVGIATNLVRSFVKIYVSTIFSLGLGYLVALFDEDLRTLHDRIVVTYVTRKIED